MARNKKKVLYVCPQSALGGAEQVTLSLARGHERWDPTILFFSEGPLVEEARGNGIPVHILSGGRPRLRHPVSVARAIGEIARVIRNEQADLVHGVMAYSHLFSGPAALATRVPSVWFQHGPVENLDWVTARIPTKMIFVNSQYTLERQKRFHPAGRIEVIYPGIALEVEPVAPLRAHFDLEPESLAFGIIGRIAPLKGHREFLQAAKTVARNLPQARFLVIGSPFMPGDLRYLREIQDLSHSLGIENRVRFTGFLPKAEALSLCDVVVNASSVPEGFGLTIVEGMGAGKPVLAPACGGPLEIIRPGTDGLLFEPGNPADLADRMTQLGENEGLRARLSREALSTVKQRFQVKRMVKDIEDRYDEIVKVR